MKAVGSPRAGALDQLGPVDIEAPTPAAGEVVVRVIAAALNPADLKVHRGEFAGRVLHARTQPLVTGYDLSGVVDACGAGVDDLHAGDEVFGMLPYSSKNRVGALSERVAIARSGVAKKPAKITHATAAAAATSGLSALQALRDKGRIYTGARVLVIGAAGGVGSLAIGVAKSLGAHVTGVCSGSAVELVRELGAEEVVDRKLIEPTKIPGPFDIIFDTSAAYSFAGMRHMLAPKGAFVTTLPSGSWLAGKVMSAFSSKRCHMLLVRADSADLAQLAAWIEADMRVPIDSTFPVRDLAAALKKLDGGSLRGKIVIDVDGGW